MTDAGTPAAASTTPVPAKPPLIVWDVVVTTILLVIGLPLVFIAGVFALALPMASDPCGSGITCNDTQLLIGWIIAMAAPLFFLVAVVIAITRMVRRKLSFWVVLVGGAATAIVWFGGVLLVVAAVPGTTL